MRLPLHRLFFSILARALPRRGVLALVVAASAASCSSSPETPESPKELVVYTWWKQGSEKVARDALFDEVRKRYPGIAITDVDPSMWDTRRGSVADGSWPPPMDASATIGGSDVSAWVDRMKLRPLDGISAAQGWARAFPKPLLEAFTWRGALYGVPLEVERDNTLFYNQQVLADAGVTPPRSIDEFFTVAEALKARGITPLSVSASGGWTIASQVFEAMLVAKAGPEFVQSYLAGSQTADAPEMESTLTDLGRMMDYANADRATTGWGDAIQKVCAGTAAMVYLPDFVQSQFAVFGCGPDKIGYVAVEPANTPTFVFVSSAFVLPGDAPHPDAAVGFAEVVASIDGQRAFSLPKGSIPARFDVPLDGFDPIAQRTMADYAASQHHVAGYPLVTSAAFQEAVNPALQAFVDPSRPEFKDVPQLLSVLRSNYSIIVPYP